jgi:hypothetical protein
MRDLPERAEQPNGRGGKPFRGGERPGGRQLEDQVAAASNRGFCSREFRHYGKVSALYDIPAHYGDNAAVPQCLPSQRYVARVPGMKRVIFRYDTCYGHDKTPFERKIAELLLSFGLQWSKIAGNNPILLHGFKENKFWEMYQ